MDGVHLKRDSKVKPNALKRGNKWGRVRSDINDNAPMIVTKADGTRTLVTDVRMPDSTRNYLRGEDKDYLYI
jgi:hypothetical protein